MLIRKDVTKRRVVILAFRRAQQIGLEISGLTARIQSFLETEPGAEGRPQVVRVMRDFHLHIRQLGGLRNQILLPDYGQPGKEKGEQPSISRAVRGDIRKEREIHNGVQSRMIRLSATFDFSFAVELLSVLDQTSDNHKHVLAIDELRKAPIEDGPRIKCSDVQAMRDAMDELAEDIFSNVGFAA